MTMEYVLEMTPISTFVAPFVLLCMMGALIVTIVYLIVEGYDAESRRTTEPTGAESVIYENDKNVVVEKNTSRGWMDVSRIQSLSTLFSSPTNILDAKFRVSKNGEVVDIRADFGVVYVSKSGMVVNESSYHLAKFNVTKITVVEMESKLEAVSRGVVRKLLDHSIGNQIIVEYEITNEEDLARDMVVKAQTKEMLQQLVTSVKGDN